MKRLQHENLVRLLAVCSEGSLEGAPGAGGSEGLEGVPRQPIYIVTEFLRHGSLLDYLRKARPPRLSLSLSLSIAIRMRSLNAARGRAGPGRDHPAAGADRHNGAGGVRHGVPGEGEVRAPRPRRQVRT